MKRTHRNLWSCVFAAVLGCLTLSVFYQLQYYGPESVILRFNEAIKNQDGAELENLIVGRREGPDVERLIDGIYQLDKQGATMQIVRLEPISNEVRVVAVFLGRQGTVMAMIWVVEKRGQTWYVDVGKTATILSDEFR